MAAVGVMSIMVGTCLAQQRSLMSNRISEKPDIMIISGHQMVKLPGTKDQPMGEGQFSILSHEKMSVFTDIWDFGGIFD